jgi:hypothetical protein
VRSTYCKGSIRLPSNRFRAINRFAFIISILSLQLA